MRRVRPSTAASPRVSASDTHEQTGLSRRQLYGEDVRETIGTTTGEGGHLTGTPMVAASCRDKVAMPEAVEASRNAMNDTHEMVMTGVAVCGGG
jgi:hypothetical protein